MKITKNELKQLVQEAVKAKLQEGSSDFTAKRHIVQAAQNASMSFETEIVSLLNLKNPDEMHPNVQEQYFHIVKDMEERIVAAVEDTVTALTGYPRNESGKE